MVPWHGPAVGGHMPTSTEAMTYEDLQKIGQKLTVRIREAVECHDQEEVERLADGKSSGGASGGGYTGPNSSRRRAYGEI